MKKTPGPRAPPERSRPRRNITARSYSWIVKIYSAQSALEQIPSYLNHFDDEEKGERKGGDDHEEGGDCEKVSTDARPLFTHLPLLILPRRRSVVPVHRRDCTTVAGFLLGTAGVEVVSWGSWDPGTGIPGSFTHGEIEGGTIQSPTAAKVWQNQKYEEFITAREDSSGGGGFIAATPPKAKSLL